MAGLVGRLPTLTEGAGPVRRRTYATMAAIGAAAGVAMFPTVAGASGASFAFGTPGPHDATVTMPTECTPETPCSLFANEVAHLGIQTTWAGPYTVPGASVVVTFPAGWCGEVQLDVIGTDHTGRKGDIDACSSTPPSTVPPTTVPPTVPPSTVPPIVTRPPASSPPSVPAPSSVPVVAPVVPVATVSPAPTGSSGPQLPNTGLNLWPVGIVGSVLVGIGAPMALIRRRNS